MKLDELRSEIECIASDMLSILEPLCQRYSRSWARIMREELESVCPNFQLLINYAKSYHEEADGDGDSLIFMAEEIAASARRLEQAEIDALHSLQQEASLASTGPKSSLDH